MHFFFPVTPWTSICLHTCTKGGKKEILEIWLAMCCDIPVACISSVKPSYLWSKRGRYWWCENVTLVWGMLSSTLKCSTTTFFPKYYLPPPLPPRSIPVAKLLSIVFWNDRKGQAPCLSLLTELGTWEALASTSVCLGWRGIWCQICLYTFEAKNLHIHSCLFQDEEGVQCEKWNSCIWFWKLW